MDSFWMEVVQQFPTFAGLVILAAVQWRIYQDMSGRYDRLLLWVLEQSDLDQAQLQALIGRK